MGYKLAGYEVDGFCEIDKEMSGCYQANMVVEHPYVMPIQEFNKMLKDHGVPSWLSDINILDGSPPCSSFSMAGNREDDWGKDKMFREGQAKQVLDDLFFHFIETAKILRAPVVIAENVRGMIIGEARKYVAEIFLRFSDAGYDTQLFLLNASKMGVPQKRQRTFFVARRKGFGSVVNFKFNEHPITVADAFRGIKYEDHGNLLMKPGSKVLQYWKGTPPGNSMSDAAGGSNFTNMRIAIYEPSCTITSSAYFTHHSIPRRLTKAEYLRLQSFPDDYQLPDAKAQFVCGMSVPPLMMQRVAGEVARQIFNN